MSDLGGKSRSGRARQARTIPLSYEQKKFITANDVISDAANAEVYDGITETKGHAILDAARSFSTTYDALKDAPLSSFFKLADAYKRFRTSVECNTRFEIDSAADMLGAVRGHNLAIRHRHALGADNRGEEIAIPAELDARKTGTGSLTHVNLFARAAAGRVFAEMVQHYYDVRVGYERDHASAVSPSI